MKINPLNNLHNGQEAQLQFQAIINDKSSKEIVLQVIKELMIPHASITLGTIRDAVKMLDKQDSPKILLVDVSSSDMPLSDINDLAEVCEPSVDVVVIGDRNDVGIFRELLKFGVKDYLVKPISAELIKKTLLEIDNKEAKKTASGRTGKLVTFVGARGGVGSSLLASSTAWNISNNRNRKTTVVDYDLQHGTAGLFLGCQPKSMLAEALSNRDMIDALFVDRCATKISTNLYYLGNDEDIDSNRTIDYDALKDLNSVLRSKYHYVIADANIYDNKILKFLISHSNSVVIVFEGSIACAKNIVRINSLIKKHNASCKIIYVYNKFDTKSSSLLSPSIFANIVEEEVSITIPYVSNINNTLIQSNNISGIYNTSISKKLTQLVDIVVTGNNKTTNRKRWIPSIMRY